jgi:hypothetical protein
MRRMGKQECVGPLPAHRCRAPTNAAEPTKPAGIVHQPQRADGADRCLTSRRRQSGALFCYGWRGGKRRVVLREIADAIAVGVNVEVALAGVGIVYQSERASAFDGGLQHRRFGPRVLSEPATRLSTSLSFSRSISGSIPGLCEDWMKKRCAKCMQAEAGTFSVNTMTPVGIKTESARRLNNRRADWLGRCSSSGS